MQSGNKIALQKRPSKGVLAGLWGFPNAEGRLSLEEAEQWLKNAGVCPKKIETGPKGNHIFTHLEWKIESFFVLCSQSPEPFYWVSAEEIEKQISLPSAFRKFFLWLTEKTGVL